MTNKKQSLMQRFFSNDLLILGGIFFVFGYVIPSDEESVIPSIISAILILLFLFFVVKIFLGKTPKFLSQGKNKYPKIAAYFASIGWITYLIAGIVILLYIALLSTSFTNWLEQISKNESFSDFMENYFPLIYYGVLFVCFAFATYFNFFYQKIKTTTPRKK